MTAIPASLRQAFQQLLPLTGLLWYIDQQGVPSCLIKVPHGVHFSDLSVILYTPRELYPSLRAGHSQERTRLALPYGTQIAPGQPYSKQTHMFHPSSLEERNLLTRLAQASHLLLIGYSSDPDPRYLGSKQLTWEENMRRTVQQWLALHIPETRRSVPATRRIETHEQQAEHTQWTLPNGAKRTIAFSMMRGLITMPGETAEVIPRIYVKVPRGTRFEEVAVAFGPLNLTRYPTGWVLSLSLRLQDATGRILLTDALCDPIGGRRLLRRLASTAVVEMVALADTSAFPVLGAKRLNWSAQKRGRAQALFDYTRTAKSRGSWKQARMEYLQEHQQGYVFQVQFPETPDLGKKEEGSGVPVLRSSSPRDEKTMPQDETGERFQTPDAGAPAPGAASAGEPVPPISLVERFVQLHRAGVYEEWSRTHTLSHRLFWRMLLAIGLEQTRRKFIWTLEAAQVTEAHREQLTPGLLVPWLSSREHLWITFAEPIETPACAETAALFVFSAADPSLLGAFAQQVGLSSRALKALERDLYAPEKQRVSLGIVNRAGAIAWSISLKTERHGQPRDAEGVWASPEWYTCPRQQCHLHTEGVATLCDTCAATRTFVWTWLVAAYQAALGLYRTRPEEEGPLETAREEQFERVSRAMPGPTERGTIRHVDLEYRYRVVRSIDIADAPAPPKTEAAGQRGSWVEALSSIDPALVIYDEREVPLRTRTLRHPRYARYIAQHGTNQVEVRPHTKHVPMRADPKGMTRVTAKRHEKHPPSE